MLRSLPRWALVGGWMAFLAAVVAASVAMDAALSTIALLIVMGVAPAVVMLVLGRGTPSPSVAEILHTAETGGARQLKRR